MSKSLYLIDGHAYCYQSFFALASLHSPDGLPTNAVYGFAKLVQKILREDKPEYLAICFDKGPSTSRTSIYKEYKATRKPMPEEMRIQMPIIKEMLLAYRIPIFEKEGYEADDLLGTLAMQGEQKGMKVLICTPDKDAGQLVTENIKIYDTRKNFQIGPQEILSEYRLPPSKLADYFALIGDKVDNIPGVKGIGPQKALQLLEQWDTLEKIYENLDRVTPERVKKLLTQYREEAFLSKKLFIIDTQVEIPADLDSCRVGSVDSEKIASLFCRLGFRSLLSQIQSASASSEREEVHEIENKEELIEWVSRIGKEEEVILSCSMQGEHVWDTRIDGFFFSGKNQTVYVPGSLQGTDVLDILGPVLQEGPRKSSHDLKSLYNALATQGITLSPLGFDTLLASYLINPGEKEFSLPSISMEYLSLRFAEEEKDKNKAKYFATRISVIRKLIEKLRPLLSEKGLDRLFEEIEIPLVPILSEMELTGIHVDKDLLEPLSIELKSKLSLLEEEIYAAAGERFNISAPKQLGTILFDKLQLQKGKKTKTGYSTDMKILETLAPRHPVPRLVLEYRQMAKFVNTYVDVLPGMIHIRSKRVHTSFNQTSTATGRLSSSSPNLQNIPVRTDLGRKIRSAFVSASGHRLLMADYSQIELRILAHFSEDPRLMEAFQNDRDIHTEVASSIFHIEANQVSEAQRRIAKAVNFGIIYGETPYGLSTALDFTVKESKAFIDAYFERYVGVKEYIEKTLLETKTRKYITTLLGRRRYFPDIDSPNPNVRKFSERAAINAVMQGTSSDIIKKAMIAICRKRNERMLNFRLLLQIHDELIFEVPESGSEEIQELIRTEMVSAVALNVPLKVDISLGKNWLNPLTP